MNSISVKDGQWVVPEEWADKWVSIINRAMSTKEKYERACGVARDIGLAAGEVLKNGDEVPIAAFRRGVFFTLGRMLGQREARPDIAGVEEDFFNAGWLVATFMFAVTADSLDNPPSLKDFENAFVEGVNDRVIRRQDHGTFRAVDQNTA